MERVDGTQARLKLRRGRRARHTRYRGKGGWDSGEIETGKHRDHPVNWECGKGGWDSGEIETPPDIGTIAYRMAVERVDGTQARLKLRRYV